MKIITLTKLTAIFSISISLLGVASASINSEIVDVDITKLEHGRCIIVEWEQSPVSICRRTNTQVTALKNRKASELGDPEGTEVIKSISHMSGTSSTEKASHIYAMQAELEGTATRSLKDEYFVVIQVSPYDGCSLTFRPDIAPNDLGKNWQGGFFNPCSGEGYDMAGRVLSGHKLGNNWNLRIPPYKYISNGIIRLGETPKTYKVKKYDFSPNLYSKYYYIEQRLFLASLWGDEDAILNILNKGIDPNKVNVGGVYPLHMAVLGQRYGAIKLLLEHGAKPDIVNSKGTSPLDFSKTLKLTKITKLLNEYKK